MEEKKNIKNNLRQGFFYEPGCIATINFSGTVYPEERRALLYDITLLNFY